MAQFQLEIPKKLNLWYDVIEKKRTSLKIGLWNVSHFPSNFEPTKKARVLGQHVIPCFKNSPLPGHIIHKEFYHCTGNLIKHVLFAAHCEKAVRVNLVRNLRILIKKLLKILRQSTSESKWFALSSTSGFWRNKLLKSFFSLFIFKLNWFWRTFRQVDKVLFRTII